MSLSAAVALKNHPAFTGLSEASQLELKNTTKVVQFQPGQPLCHSRELPNQVQLIVSGKARLIVREQNRSKTLTKLGSGELVGLSSLIRAKSCETVSASTAVLAISIPDRTILKLLTEESTFKRYCSRTLWHAEVFALIQPKVELLAFGGASLTQVFPRLFKEALLVEPTPDGVVETLQKKRDVWIASANSSKKLGHAINANESLPRTEGPLSLRLISLPENMIAEVNGSLENEKNKELSNINEDDLNIQPAEIPLKSNLDFGQIRPERNLELVEGNGTVEEILACFQMLSNLLKLPFRRDSVEKIVRDSLRRGQTPNIQLIGQLASSLGLHVVGAKVPASVGLRMQTPALVNYQGGFSLAVSSTAEGLKLASPRNGWVHVSQNDLEEVFPEGISALLVDRTSSTPEKRFGFDWFVPILQRHRDVLVQVLIASFVVQLFTLANPLLIQVIIDKVINQRSLDTLQVLGFALIGVTLLEGVLGSLKLFYFRKQQTELI